MIRMRLQAVLLYLFCTVFMAVQSTSTHAHLNTAHQHDGALHEHVTNVHAHPSLIHADAIDLGHSQENLTAVVDLESNQCLPNCQSGDDVPLATAAAIARLSPQRGAQRFSHAGSLLPQRPPPHSGEPRAPPLR